jgi:hypothetical protein
MLKVISPKILPSRPPVTFSLVVWLLLEYYGVHGTWRGVALALLVVVWVLVVFVVYKEERVDIVEQLDNLQTQVINHMRRPH